MQSKYRKAADLSNHCDATMRLMPISTSRPIFLIDLFHPQCSIIPMSVLKMTPPPKKGKDHDFLQFKLSPCVFENWHWEIFSKNLAFFQKRSKAMTWATALVLALALLSCGTPCFVSDAAGDVFIASPCWWRYRTMLHQNAIPAEKIGQMPTKTYLFCNECFQII